MLERLRRPSCSGGKGGRLLSLKLDPAGPELHTLHLERQCPAPKSLHLRPFTENLRPQTQAVEPASTTPKIFKSRSCGLCETWGSVFRQTLTMSCKACRRLFRASICEPRTCDVSAASFRGQEKSSKTKKERRSEITTERNTERRTAVQRRKKDRKKERK